MGAALSRLIASLFGEKEVRILILGLDNGALLLLFVAQFFIHGLCCVLSRVLHPLMLETTIRYCCVCTCARNNIFESCLPGGVITVISCSGKDFNPVSFEGRHFPLHCTEYVVAASER